MAALVPRARPGAARVPGILGVLALALALLALAGCGEGTAGTSDGTDQSTSGFPVQIENTFGTTTIEQKPERIVTLGWNAQDVVYALGETPVGMPKYTYGADDDGVMPWDQRYFDPDETTLLDTTDGQPFEAIAKLQPDVILAPYEGFDKQTYETLSKIAPTVAYPDKPWQTSWQDQTTIIGKALGKPDEAKKLVEQTTKSISKAAHRHPEFDGKTITVASFGSSKVSVYLPDDPRVQMMDELGFEPSSGVRTLAKGSGGSQFYADVSWENVTQVDADVVVGYLDGLSKKQLEHDKPFRTLSAADHDAALVLDDERTVAGLSQPTVLSIDWTLDRILPKLSTVAKRARG